jgi:type IV pilus assembly protein PilQ
MRLSYRLSTLLGLFVALGLGILAPLKASAVRPDAATLTKIASRVDDRSGIVTIEASDPVPYVSSQPDPRVLVLELRDVKAAGFSDQFRADPRNPVAAVHVESAQAVDGSSVARVRLTLNHPMRPRVRSTRNLIVVEADRLESGVRDAGVISQAGPASAIRDVRVTRRGGATAISLLGTGRLAASSVQEETRGAHRLVIDLPNVTSAMQATTAVKQGPVDNVRIALSPRSAMVTQVVMDLSRPTSYRLESSPDGNDLTVVFDEPVDDPVAALRPAAAPAAVPVALPAATVAPRAVPTRFAQQTPASTVAQDGEQKVSPKYSGHPVSLDFQGADLRAVLRTFSEISGLNIVIDPTIQGTVDVALRDVPWDQALDIILRANKLGYAVDGTIVRVAPLTVLSEEEQQRRKLVEEQALAGELKVLTRALSYAKAVDIAKLLEEARVISGRGSIYTHDDTNTIIINDLADRLDRSSELIAVLDVPQPQVEIEARIVETTRTFARSLGVTWGFGGALSTSNPTRVGAISTDTALAVSKAPASTLALGLMGPDMNLDVALSALESTGQGRVLSTPRVSTQNNIEAEITQGFQIPIQTVANNTVTVSFKDAALTLKVKPQITAANTVIMQISVENATPDFARMVNNIPPIDTQRANTRVLVTNGETTVIGGIYKSREQMTEDRTPGLHRLPLFGWLFKRNDVNDESRELLIFITPKIQRH